MAADVIFLRAATNAAAACRVALDLPTAGDAAGLLVAGLAGAAVAALLMSACAASATFFLVGISAFRWIVPAAVVAAGLVDGERLAPLPASVRAAPGATRVAGVRVGSAAARAGPFPALVATSAGAFAFALVAGAALGWTRAAPEAGFAAADGFVAALVRLRDVGCTAVRAAALDAATGLAVAGLAACVPLRPFVPAVLAGLDAIGAFAAFDDDAPEAALATAGVRLDSVAFVATGLTAAGLIAALLAVAGLAAGLGPRVTFVFGGMMPLLDRRGR